MAKKAMDWDGEAVAAVERAPFFVRRLVRQKVEEYVDARGGARVTALDVQSARHSFLDGGQGSATPSEPVVEPVRQTSARPTLEVPLSEKELRAIERLAQEKAGTETRYYAVRACGGAVGCPLTVGEDAKLADVLAAHLATSGLEAFLEGAIKGPVLTHHKFRAVVAGCANNCSEPQIADFAVVAQARPRLGPGECCDCDRCREVCREGAIALDGGPRFDYAACLNCGRCAANCQSEAIAVGERGYDVLVGGKLGRHPRLATRVLAMVDEEAVLGAFDACLAFYLAEARGPERLGAVLERTGLEPLLQRLQR